MPSIRACFSPRVQRSPKVVRMVTFEPQSKVMAIITTVISKQLSESLSNVVLISKLEKLKPIVSPSPIGGSSYNWMAPSLQSQDPSFTIGSVEGTQPSTSSESLQSSLLFSKMKPPKRPLRAIGLGDGFGKERLRPDDTATQG